jgi:potassium/hydrogen antiporter
MRGVTNTAILAASGMLLVAYALEHFGRHFRLPSVVLLIVVGLIARQVLQYFGLFYHWVQPIVPVIGTLGLILIVLEGALDLTVTKERLPLIIHSAASSIASFLLCLAAFALMFGYLLHFQTHIAILMAIPFAVISSAVAIPSASGLPAMRQEFIVYESSFSDILGVLVFYAWLGGDGIGDFAADLLGGGAASIVAALVAGLALFYFINQIDGHVRFLPLLAGLVFLYAIGKEMHLSPLIVVLVSGLVINNPRLLTWHRRLRRMKTEAYAQTLKEFKGLVAELTFATKSFFFLLLGYWTDVSSMISVEAWLVAIAGIAFILASRWLILKLLRQDGVSQLVWIAPRGLVTVLLILSATSNAKVENFPFGAVMLVVLITAALTGFAHRGAHGEVAAQTARAEERSPTPTS